MISDRLQRLVISDRLQLVISGRFQLVISDRLQRLVISDRLQLVISDRLQKRSEKCYDKSAMIKVSQLFKEHEKDSNSLLSPLGLIVAGYVDEFCSVRAASHKRYASKNAQLCPFELIKISLRSNVNGLSKMTLIVCPCVRDSLKTRATRVIEYCS